MLEAAELRGQIARSLHGCVDTIIKETVALFPFAGVEHVATDDRAPLTQRAIHLLMTAVRDGTCTADDVLVAELTLIAERAGIRVRQIFTVVYLVERAALDALAQDDSFGATSSSWPTLTQVVRGAAFELCGAVAERIVGGSAAPSITDPLTTLHTRAVFFAAVEREIQRSERFGDPFALILMEVDHLADINAQYGYGAGNRVLERVGIVVRHFFRETDWAARLSDHMFGVLLPAIQGDNAERMAERIRVAVQERLEVHDHRSDQPFPVTISVGVLRVESVARTEKAERLIAAAEDATDRARTAGGNRLERATIGPPGGEG